MKSPYDVILNIREWVIHHRCGNRSIQTLSCAHWNIRPRWEISTLIEIPGSPRLTPKAGRTRWFGAQAARSNQADWTHRWIAPVGDNLQISSYAFSQLIDSRRAFSAPDRHVLASRELCRFALSRRASPVTPGLFAIRRPRQGLWRRKQAPARARFTAQIADSSAWNARASNHTRSTTVRARTDLCNRELTQAKVHSWFQMSSQFPGFQFELAQLETTPFDIAEEPENRSLLVRLHFGSAMIGWFIRNLEKWKSFSFPLTSTVKPLYIK